MSNGTFERTITVTGKHAVKSFLSSSSRYRVLEVEVSTAFVKSNDWPSIRQTLEQLIIKYRTVQSQAIQARAGAAASQGIMAKVALKMGHVSMLDEWLGGDRRCLILDHLQDPHNVGACIRSALAFGVDVIVIAKTGACAITPAVAKVAAGAIGQVDICEANISQAIGRIQELGIWVMATSERAEQSIDEMDLPQRVAWVVGNEEKGVSHQVKKICDQLVRIDTAPNFPSLNVSVATGILLYRSGR